MSTSEASTAPVSSAKRPLEDPSSDSGPGDQPEAKRPALDAGVNQESPANGLPTEATPSTTADVDANGDADNGNKTTVPPPTTNVAPTTETPVPATSSLPSAATVLETQPIQSTTSINAGAGSSVGEAQDETNWLHVRAVISSAEAATIIGKGGENVTTIRRMAGAKCTISEYSRGAVERILTVSGLVDAISKAFGLIIRTLNSEPLEEPSNGQSKTYQLHLLVPHILIGAIIGHRGTRIREIQEQSGARLNVSDSCLPMSSERSLNVHGVADAVHIATYYIGSSLVVQLTEKFGGPAASAYATRSGGPAGVSPGGMQIVPYSPASAGGSWGHPGSYNQRQAPAGRPPSVAAPYNAPQHGYAQPAQPQNMMHYGAPNRGYMGVGPAAPQSAQYPQPAMAHPQGGQGSGPPQGGAFPGQPLTQQIFIPNDMVGAIIGKGGAKINEIRQASGSVIKINEPSDNTNERLVTITGIQEHNQMALFLLYQRLESEKHRM